ncbi:MAG: aminoacyl-histidine dipeptidase [Bacteroidota bacterium]
MSQDIKQLNPRGLWSNFADLNAVPRASKREERVIQFIVDFGQRLGLDTSVDAVGNVLIKKPATPGMENRQTVVLQSHLDMVHQKNAATNFDFATEGIKMYVEADWVKAEGTTLGADNGIGVASIMAVLEATDIEHPALEALFTIDEETGMTGAKGLEAGWLSGDILLNLDTEDDDELTIGCAGGIDLSARGTYTPHAVVDLNEGARAYRLSIKGLSGGHSGMDIHKGLGNANKLMNRLLFLLEEQYNLSIAQIDGGGLRNAIPRESFADLVLGATDFAQFEQSIAQIGAELRAEHRSTDPDLELRVERIDLPPSVLPADFQGQLLRAIYACPNGIFRMSPTIPGLVQSSNNLARVKVAAGEYECLCLTRSSVDTEKFDLARAIRSAFEMLGAEVSLQSDYPGWTPKPEAAIIRTMSELYREMFDAEPRVNACHAGLECGILGTHYPAMEMISFGPNIRGAHSPDEKVQISSVQKYWPYLLETLRRIPQR